ncbi:NACHT, LRR and PYD domains-containing protein 3-like isoform X2 [Scyliorhinus canicula]|uniref:NACHT, LRR and PYD domains-containing protein 3-like isoform X2 n=1 Tax=Scyliorhinus canicula TaxID=7830 RepID=UPI0018F4F966|nr:NACHT, LRR and PYD domains-containing protein 3-like isoform X2 [Scyliorhinus canicula]
MEDGLTSLRVLPISHRDNDGPGAEFGDETRQLLCCEVKEEDLPMGERNTDTRPPQEDLIGEGIGTDDCSSDMHLYRVSRFYCQRLLLATDGFVERLTSAPLEEALLHRQEQEELQPGTEMKEREEPSRNLLKMLKERDKTLGESMGNFLTRLCDVKKNLQDLLKDTVEREVFCGAPGGSAGHPSTSQTDIISVGTGGRQLRNIESVVAKRRLLDTMYLMSETHNTNLLQMSRITLGDSKEPGNALRLCPVDCSTLATALTPLGGIEEVNISHCCIGPEGLQELATVLHHCRSLRLSWNNLGDLGVKILCLSLREPQCKIQELWVDSNGLSGVGTKDLAYCMVKNQSVVLLSLSYNRFGEAAVKYLCDALKRRCCTIQDLRLGSNRLTALCTLQLTRALNTNRSLRQLSLNYNRLGVPGLRRLSTALKGAACRIQKLELDENGLRDSCAEDLAAALSENRWLKGLYLNRNCFTDRSIPAFQRLATGCRSLRYLWLWRNQFSTEGRVELQTVQETAHRVTIFV